MKKLISLVLLSSSIFSINLMAEEISSVESNGSWIYVYNSQGKKYKTFSTSSVGEIKGYSSRIFVSEKGSWIYVYDAEGKKIATLSKSTVGEVIGVAGSTFTSRKGNWIYTWSQEGKKINTRYAG